MCIEINFFSNGKKGDTEIQMKGKKLGKWLAGGFILCPLHCITQNALPCRLSLSLKAGTQVQQW